MGKKEMPGSVIARICYEKILQSGDKKHITIGKLIYFRSHKEGSEPSASFRWDLCPAQAWANNPETWFVGNFLPSEKVPEAPHIDGDIYVTSDIMKDRVIIGHIKTRDDKYDPGTGDYLVQYYLQLHGIPMGAVIKQQRNAFMRVVEMWVTTERAVEEPSRTETMMENLKELFSAKKKSIYCSIDM